MKLIAPCLVLLPCLLLGACQSAPRQAAEPTQCDIARFQARTLVDGMKGLETLREGETEGAAIFFESMVYNAAVDVLECQEYKYDRRLMVWINDLAEYRKLHPRPAGERTPIDARLDKLLADYQGKTPLPIRMQGGGE